MNKRASVLAAVAALILLSGVAAADDAEGTSAHGPSAPAVKPAQGPALCPSPGVLFEAAAGGRGKGGGGQECTCSATADCGTSTISCTDTTGPCRCESVDGNCLGQQGYVKCDGVTQLCPPCCLYIYCENGRSCTTHDDCCANVGPSGFCSGGQCQCSL